MAQRVNVGLEEECAIPLQLTEFDTSAYLDNEEVIAEYLTAALEDGDPNLFQVAAGNVAKARARMAQATGESESR